MTSAAHPTWPDTARAVYQAARPYERDRFDVSIGVSEIDGSLVRACCAVAVLTALADRTADIPPPIMEWVAAHWDTRIIALQHQVGGTTMQLRMILTATLWFRHTGGLDLDVAAVHDLAQRASLVLTGIGYQQAQDA
ncbi:MAG: hypothetical protein ACRCZP_11615 [Phycicoccus sp.]